MEILNRELPMFQDDHGSQRKYWKDIFQNWPQLIFRIAVSGVLIFFLYWYFSDKIEREDEVWALILQAKLFFIIPFFVLIGLSLLTLGFRFYYLLDKRIPFREALYFTCVGSGANMILPARGGDFLRVAWTKKRLGKHKKTSISYFGIAMLILFERFLDFFFALTAGCLALMFIDIRYISSAPWLQNFLLPLILIWCLVLTILLSMTVFEEKFGNLLKIISRFLNKNKGLKKIAKKKTILASFITVITDAVQQGKGINQISICKSHLPKILILSFFCWFIFNASAMAMVYIILNIPLVWGHLMFIQFASVLGLLIPAAPSGIGAIHASITSGFYVTNFSEQQGLLFATGFHFLNTIGVLLYAIFFIILRPLINSPIDPSISDKKIRRNV